ncbi:DUF4440 domain-containing protein [Paracoccus aurantiacus]|uniref:DUF4440 domain-containing protein n=1 Tax=Paracoccus aurantiacus TaxID=2599412 RepID=A0A5C6S9M2_9RHOB|nr:DUF4440 domain-containing protein [Paracoccus aurantiacus]TXB71156.1 DUF4440 domain-containing protein [Paracoccus aurantiacus]
MSDELWRLEQMWWTGGVAEALRHMAPNCIMVFPTAVLQGTEIAQSLSGVPRWDDLTMTDRRTAESDDVVVLSYRAEARRGSERPHRVRCSSCWVRLGGWRLICHQQTPV